MNLQTDLVPSEEFSEAELTLLPLDELGSAKRSFVDAESGNYLPSGLLEEFDGIREDQYRLGVSLRTGDGVVLVEQPALLDVQDNLVVTARISRSCLNVSCAEDEACFAGQCVDFRCTPETPEFCEGISFCSADSDCESASACSAPQCLDGQCLYAAKQPEQSGACDPDTEWCHPEQGCLLRGAGQQSEAPNFPVLDLDPYTVAEGLMLETPFSARSETIVNYLGQGSAIVSMPEGRAMPSGVYLTRAGEGVANAVLFAEEGSLFEEFAVPDFAIDGTADMVITPRNSSYGDRILLASVSNNDGDGIFSLDASGTFTALSESNQVNNSAAVAFDLDNRLFSQEVGAALYFAGNPSGDPRVFYMSPTGDLDRLITTATDGVYGLAIPQQGSLVGAAYLATGTGILRLTPSEGNLVADLSPWTTDTGGSVTALVSASANSLVGEGLLVADETSGEVRLFAPDASSTLVVGGLLDPSDIDLSEDEQALFILERGRGQVLRLSAER